MSNPGDISTQQDLPSISVVVLNYNGARWVERCLKSLQDQTIYEQIEVIVADNQSSDGSDKLAESIIRGCANSRFVRNEGNYGFCEGNNRGASGARGEYLFFLNNDAWMEPDCLEILLRETSAAKAAASTPLVMDFDDNHFQSLGAAGFDIFGLTTCRLPHSNTREVLMPEGCSFFIRRKLFQSIGGFDSEFFMFSDEYDLAWRIWIAGERCVAVPSAHLHHRGAANVNPEGGAKVVEFRTSQTKRFYANRNSLLVILKNAKNLLLLMACLQIGLLAVESLVALIIVRRWAFVRKSYFDAIADCWRLRRHIWSCRASAKVFRKRSDWWMLRFLKLRMNRWDELLKMRKMGLPRVTST
jgi:GT2 family glycosyltransferase